MNSKVITKDSSGGENGWLLELYKSGRKTKVYLTALAPKAFKGFHLHRVRISNYVCIKGQVLVSLYTFNTKWLKSEHLLSVGDTLTIPTNVATGITNLGDEEAWLTNAPNPFYDPELKDEQVEYTIEDLEAGTLK